MRPDRTIRTFWRTAIDEPAFEDSGLKVLLPEASTLSGLAPELFVYQTLPELWASEEKTRARQRAAAVARGDAASSASSGIAV